MGHLEAFPGEKIVYWIWFLATLLSWFGLLSYLLKRCFLFPIIWRLIPPAMILPPIILTTYHSIRLWLIYGIGEGPNLTSLYPIFDNKLVFCLPLYYSLFQLSYFNYEITPKLFEWSKIFHVKGSNI